MVREMSIEDGFWSGRISTAVNSTLPSIYESYKVTGRWDAFKMTWKHGDPNEPHLFWDSDIAKLTESLCYALQHMDPSDPLYSRFLDWIDQAIDMVTKAQWRDGYINIYYTVVEPRKRWTDVAEHCELYNAGHLLEAAVAHYELTHDLRFVNVMCRYVDYISHVFGSGDGQLRGYPGHQVLELALLRLIESVPEKRLDKYFKLAQYFIEERGRNHGEYYDQEALARGVDPTKYIPTLPPDYKNPWFPEPQSYWYMQADERIRDLKQLRGHSVRTMYYLTAVQHLANITDDSTLDAAVDRLWRNMVDQKLYAHGGIGAIKKWEGHGEDYELLMECYSETCASVGILFLGRRMLQRRLRGEVAEIMELALYNNVLAGNAIDGHSFFYDQPLTANGFKRSGWFKVACCPPNVTRLLASLERYVFTTSDTMVALNLFIGSKINGDGFRVHVHTQYPQSGQLRVCLHSDRPIAFAVRRPPGHYKCSSEGVEKDGYIHFAERAWNTTIDLTWFVKPFILLPTPKVEATRGKLAIKRGPFLYVLEEIDIDVPIDSVILSKSTKLEEVVVIKSVEVTAVLAHCDGHIIRFVPYFCYGHRQPGCKMRAWIPDK